MIHNITMSLRSYLKKIKQGKYINYDVFVRKLPDKYKSQQSDIFDAELVQFKPKRWKVTFKQPQFFDELWALSKKPESRVDAAVRRGDSHVHTVSASLLLVYHQQISDLRPDIVYISDNKNIQTFEHKSTLLLVENEENFIQYQYFLHVVSDFLGRKLSLNNIDIAFGSGNKATSKNLINWYHQYNEILCAFDYDLGGLIMFKTLHKQLGEKAIFVQPENYNKISYLFKKIPESEEKLLKAITLSKQLGFKELCFEFIQTRRFLEQEVLLKDF